MLELVALMPHPPAIVPEVGGNESRVISLTAQKMGALAREIKSIAPELIVVVTPHGNVFSDAVTIALTDVLRGNLGSFGAPHVGVEYPLDKEAAEAIIVFNRDKRAYCAGLEEKMLKKFGLSEELDHGAVVPLLFIKEAGWQGSLLSVNIGLLPYEELYEFGSGLAQALAGLNRRWVLLVSGDMSHCLSHGAPGGYSPQGVAFDGIIRDFVNNPNPYKIVKMDEQIINKAGECGLRPLIIGIGALDGRKIKGEELSYEGPFGVGYLVAKFIPGKRKTESELVSLARASIEYYLENASYLKPSVLKEEYGEDNGGVFVSLKKNFNLRGCIGTIERVQNSLAEEIIHNAVAAAVNDPRFEPLMLQELKNLEISVDVLGRPEPVTELSELDPQVYGVIVTRGTRKGLLLPALEGVKTPEEQLEIALEKAGIALGEKYKIARFRVTRHT